MADGNKPKGGKLARQLRRAIADTEKAGTSRYVIAKLAKTTRAQVSRIADGVTVPTLDTAEKIAEAIGYTFTLEKHS